MKAQKTRTLQEVRTEFLRKGISMASWARANGFEVATVSQVVTGRNAGTRGVGHKIAVLLNIKDGEIAEG
jgi:gp16 family phage-associated protein